MDFSEVISLIPVESQKDSINQYVKKDLPARKIFCMIESVTQTEWASTSRIGLNSAYKVTAYADEYHGEEIAVISNKRYKIYRTYRRKDDMIELYLSRKAGI